MADDIPKIVGILSSSVDPSTKEGSIMVKCEGEIRKTLRFHPGVLGNMAMAFLGMGRAAGPSPGSPGAVMQVIELTGIAAAKGPAGQLILDLVLLDGLHLPVTFPPAALPMIKTALAQLESSAKSGGKPPGRERH